MRAREFKRTRTGLGLSQVRLAKALGMSPLQVLRYEHGYAKVPRVVALALEALEGRAAEGSERQRPA